MRAWKLAGSFVPCAMAVALPALVAGDAAAVVPDVRNFCIRYAGHATSESIVAENLHCVTSGLSTWSTENNFHLNWCLSQFGDHPTPQQEADAEKAANALEAARLAQLKECQANPPAQTGGGGSTLNVVAEVTVYDTFEEGNEDKCYLHPGDKVKLLAPDGAPPPWVHVQGLSGQCSGKAGFVYNQGELK
jgi:hypothetical protein